MALVFSDRPQIYGDRRRPTDPGDISDQWAAKFPAHVRPISQMPDTPGPYGNGSWKIYTHDYNPKIGPGFGFKHRDQIWRRVPERNFHGETRFVTRGTVQNVVGFSS
jgi:hypothetical protein